MTEPCKESSNPHSRVPKELTRTVHAAYFSPDGSPLREVAFGVGLQTPGNAAHQELFVIGPRLRPEHFPVLDPQLTYALLSQAVNFAPWRCVRMAFILAHSALWFLSLCGFARVRERPSCLHLGTFTDALCRPEFWGVLTVSRFPLVGPDETGMTPPKVLKTQEV